AKGPGRLADVPSRDGRRTKDAALEERHQLREHLSEAVRARLDEVEGAVGDAWVGGTDRVWLADVGLAHLDEAPTLGQQAYRSGDEFACEAIQDQVHPASLGGLQKVRLELKIP